MLEKQQKADAAQPLCPHCQNKLSRLSGGHWTTLQTRFGPIRVSGCAVTAGVVASGALRPMRCWVCRNKEPNLRPCRRWPP